ncbi:MAG: helix-turn-helix domain-containing protein [Bacteroidota bacterium]
MKIKVGDKLLKLRTDKKMNQQDFAELLSISTSAYARLERNETQTDYDQLVRFAQVLGMPVQEFFPESIVFYNKDKHISSLEQQNSLLQEKINFLEARIEELIDTNQTLKEVLRKVSL